jgi:hypothetical protein
LKLELKCPRKSSFRELFLKSLKSKRSLKSKSQLLFPSKFPSQLTESLKNSSQLTVKLKRLSQSSNKLKRSFKLELNKSELRKLSLLSKSHLSVKFSRKLKRLLHMSTNQSRKFKSELPNQSFNNVKELLMSPPSSKRLLL